MTIKVTYNVTDVYMTQSVSPVYINVSYGGGGTSGGGVWGTITGTLSNQTDLQSALDLKVPYSGATGDVSLGEYGINVGNVIYDTNPTGIPTEQGATYWDTSAETVALIMNGTIQKIGEDTFYHVRNTTGSTIPKGTAVRFSGTTGNSGRLLIAPMLANGTYPSQYYMGITSEELVNNADGKVYHFGKMRNVNTSAFADGDVLYVSPSVAGGLTETAPVAPNNIIVAAAVVHANNNGTLMIRTTLGSNINADEGVLLTTPTANQGLFYDSGLWVNKSISTALGYTPANAATTLTINGVTYDLSTSRTWTISAGISGTIATGQVAYATAANTIGGSNNLFWDATNGRLGIGTNAPSAVLQSNNTTDGIHGLIIRASGSPLPSFSFQDGDITIPNYSTTGINPILTSNEIGRFSSLGSTIGGLQILGFSNSTDERAMFITAISGRTTATANPVMTFRSQKHNGSTSTTDLSSSDIAFAYLNGATRIAQIMGSGNLVLQNGGTFSDGGQRLQVIGDTLLRGSGATSATTALTVQNSSSTNLFSVFNNGYVSIGSSVTAFSTTNALFLNSSQPTITLYRNINGSDIKAVSYFVNSVGNLQIRTRNDLNSSGSDMLVVSRSGSLSISDGGNLIFSTINGTKIGTSTTEKISFWNATPNVQPTNAITADSFISNTSGIVDDTATFGGYTLGQIVAALKRIGALA